jgi:hypothetical protein
MTSDMQAGLCGNCGHCRKIVSARGSAFYLCKLSEVDERFPKYPPLPVLRCLGYEASENVTSEEKADSSR